MSLECNDDLDNLDDDDEEEKEEEYSIFKFEGEEDDGLFLDDYDFHSQESHRREEGRDDCTERLKRQRGLERIQRAEEVVFLVGDQRWSHWTASSCSNDNLGLLFSCEQYDCRLGRFQFSRRWGDL